MAQERKSDKRLVSDLEFLANEGLLREWERELLEKVHKRVIHKQVALDDHLRRQVEEILARRGG